MLVDQETDAAYIPLNHMNPEQTGFLEVSRVESVFLPEFCAIYYSDNSEPTLDAIVLNLFMNDVHGDGVRDTMPFMKRELQFDPVTMQSFLNFRLLTVPYQKKPCLAMNMESV